MDAPRVQKKKRAGLCDGEEAIEIYARGRRPPFSLAQLHCFTLTQFSWSVRCQVVSPTRPASPARIDDRDRQIVTHSPARPAHHHRPGPPEQTRRRPSIGSMQCPPRRGAPALDWIQSSSSATSAPMKLGEPSHVRAHAVRSGPVRSGTRPGRVRYGPTALHYTSPSGGAESELPADIHILPQSLSISPLRSSIRPRFPPTRLRARQSPPTPPPPPPLCRQQDAGA